MYYRRNHNNIVMCNFVRTLYYKKKENKYKVKIKDRTKI